MFRKSNMKQPFAKYLNYIEATGGNPEIRDFDED